MKFKTILVHLNHERRAPELIESAAKIARPSGAHVIGLYVMPPIVLLPADIIIPVGTDLIEQQMEGYRKQCERIREIFETRTKGETFVSEWRVHNGPISSLGSLSSGVVAEARTADLIVTSQASSDRDEIILVEVPERVAIESGRPVLVVPGTGEVKNFGKSIVVGWNDSKESSRAIYDAMPFLERASQVRLITVVSSKDAKKRPNAVPGGEIAATLARQGIKVSIETITDQGGAGTTLLSEVEKNRADMLVMGAYGHSRFREFVLGGVTRDVLRKAAIPVLMAH